jgi:hypothetical protein
MVAKGHDLLTLAAEQFPKLTNTEKNSSMTFSPVKLPSTRGRITPRMTCGKLSLGMSRAPSTFRSSAGYVSTARPFVRSIPRGSASMVQGLLVS